MTRSATALVAVRFLRLRCSARPIRRRSRASTLRSFLPPRAATSSSSPRATTARRRTARRRRTSSDDRLRRSASSSPTSSCGAATRSTATATKTVPSLRGVRACFSRKPARADVPLFNAPGNHEIHTSDDMPCDKPTSAKTSSMEHWNAVRLLRLPRRALHRARHRGVRPQLMVDGADQRAAHRGRPAQLAEA